MAQVHPGADGRWIVPDLPARRYRVTFAAPGFAPEVREADVPVGLTVEVPHVTLQVPGNNLVLDGHAERAAAGTQSGIRVEIQGTGYFTETTDDGTWQLPCVAGIVAGRLLSFTLPGYSPATVPLPAQLDPPTFHVPEVPRLDGEPGTLRGLVLLDERFADPTLMQSVIVALSHFEGENIVDDTQLTPTADGVFVFDGLPAGDYLIEASLHNFVTAHAAAPVGLGSRTDLAPLLLSPDDANRRGVLAGRVRMDLTNADLLRSDLTASSLRGSNLTGARLLQSQITGADLSNVHATAPSVGGAAAVLLREANLAEASLFAASLPGADMQYTQLSAVDLRNADLHGANLNGANGPDVVLTCTNLDDAALRFAHLANAEFDRNTARRADFSNGDLSGATFGYTDVSGAHFQNTVLDNAQFTWSGDCPRGTEPRAAQGCIGGNLPDEACTAAVGAVFDSASMTNAYLNGDFTDATMRNMNLTNADVRACNFQTATWGGSNFSGATLCDTDYTWLTAVGANRCVGCTNTASIARVVCALNCAAYADPCP